MNIQLREEEELLQREHGGAESSAPPSTWMPCGHPGVPCGNVAPERLPRREFKYGYCEQHRKALQVTVQYSGKHAGEVVARCPLFKQFDECGKRMCWTQKKVLLPPEQLPKAVVQKVKELKEDLRWSLRHGPQTRSSESAR